MLPQFLKHAPGKSGNSTNDYPFPRPNALTVQLSIFSDRDLRSLRRRQSVESRGSDWQRVLWQMSNDFPRRGAEWAKKANFCRFANSLTFCFL